MDADMLLGGRGRSPTQRKRECMKAGYREREHTADWELEVWGPDMSALLEQAARGMYALSGVRLWSSPRLTRELEMQAPDRESLLVGFLSELLYLGDEQRIAFDRFDLKVLGGDQLRLHASLEGAEIESQSKEIKAVTYHNLEVIEHDGRLIARVIFDV